MTGTAGRADGWRRGLSGALAGMTLGWMGLLVAVPWFAGHAAGGRPALVMSAGVYLAGGLVCHQRPDRSFRLWGAQMPVCTRCAGLYLGAAVGAVLAVGRRRGRQGGGAARRLIVAAAVPTGVTLVGEWAGWLAAPGVWRAVAALPLGAAVAWVASLAMRGEFE